MKGYNFYILHPPIRLYTSAFYIYYFIVISPMLYELTQIWDIKYYQDIIICLIRHACARASFDSATAEMSD